MLLVALVLTPKKQPDISLKMGHIHPKRSFNGSKVMRTEKNDENKRKAEQTVLIQTHPSTVQMGTPAGLVV